jgi:prepilin-type N-terminal cleavage/methylation domain-containing protein
MKEGYTLIEIIVVIAIIGILSGVTYLSYRSTLQRQQLEQEASKVVAVFEEARSLSIAGKQGSVYGVHAESSKIVRFQGQSYAIGKASNVDQVLSPYVTISTITLTGGTSDVVFSRMGGTTTASGTLTLALVASTTQTKIITIYNTGLVEVTK